MKINCVIIEDEPLAQERIKGYMQKLPFLHLMAAFDNGIDALLYLQSNPADLIFLDINIGEISGIQLLQAMHTSTEVVIITAYHEYALKGYELNVTDYLLKPFTFDRFLQAVEKVKTNLSRQGNSAEKKFIFIKTEYRLEKLLLREVLYIEGMRDYRKIHTIHKRIMTLKTFREFEADIPPAIICRVHKSFMVAIDKIDTIEKDGIKIRDQVIPLSDTYRKRFYEVITAVSR
ncbi:LytR/AlgR family response regulator transcription factor [Chitinophaga sp. 22321]|uniref:Response regulator transcription factor n=1 Tax=Chitinophaga hostae TaxID=2831022 RepID=A0ABS5JB59_9BACT|nr:LytTR family DNA-binding domain-containing protein [Chitinophaga hostae]MBS0032453.1 response regulator transcription factor [Chitinophaga hostae]